MRRLAVTQLHFLHRADHPAMGIGDARSGDAVGRIGDLAQGHGAVDRRRRRDGGHGGARLHHGEHKNCSFHGPHGMPPSRQRKENAHRKALFPGV